MTLRAPPAWTDYHFITVEPIAGALGFAIGGANLSDELPDETIAELHKALLEYLVIFLQNQFLPVDQQAHARLSTFHEH